MILGIWSQKEKVDLEMRNMKLGKNSYAKYVSFANSSRNERISALQLNKHINIKLKYECIEDAGVLDETEFEGTRQTVSEVVMGAKHKGIPLFAGVEQGLGKNAKCAYLHYKGPMATEAREWIRNTYGKQFKVEEKKNYVTSVPQITEEEKNYRNEINDSIINRLKHINIDENKEKQALSCKSVLIGTNQSKDESEQDNSTRNDEDMESLTNTSDSSAREEKLPTSESQEMKMIKELQTSMTIMQEILNKHVMHIKSLEDAVIALSNSENDAKGMQKSKKDRSKYEKEKEKES